VPLDPDTWTVAPTPVEPENDDRFEAHTGRWRPPQPCAAP
jgi:hypothetical protein